MARGKGEGAISRRGDGTYMGRIELPSRTTHPETGLPVRRRKYVYAKTKAELLRKMDEERKLLRASGDLETASMTVAQWFEYWMREIATRDRRPKTIEAYRSVIRRKIVPVIGAVRLDKLTPANIRRVTTLVETENSSTYARNVHAVMSAAFRDAERQGRLNRNPVDLVQAPRKSRTHLHVLTLDESVVLLEAFILDPAKALWATFLLTGMRRGEALGIEWDRITSRTITTDEGERVDRWEIELSWQLQRLPASGTFPADFEYRPLSNGLYLTRPKSRAGWRVIPLVDPLLSVLLRWKAVAPPNPFGLVFTRTLGDVEVPIDPDYATKLWPEVLAAEGIEKNVRLHDTRHTAVDLLYLSRVPEDVIMELVGHSTRAVTRGYKSRSEERAHAAMLQLSALVSPPPQH